MKINKFLIFTIAIIFILSINFSLAADENTTQILSDDLEEELSLENSEIIASESPENILSADEKEIMSASDDSQVLKEGDIQTIKMHGVTNRLNGGIWYKTTFFDAYGKPLQNQKMWFTFDNNVEYGYEVATDSNGVAILKAAVNNGNHKINAFNIITGDMMVDDIKVFNVITGAKNINMYYDDGTTYRVHVFDDNGKPVKAGQKVTFTINNKKYVKKTDKKGYAKLKIPSTPGLYTISVKYKDFQITNELKVKSIFNVKLIRSKDLSKVKVKVKLLGKNKKKKLVKIKFNKKMYKAKSNKKGVAVFKLKTPKKLGSYKLIVSYKKYQNDYTFTRSYL